MNSEMLRTAVALVVFHVAFLTFLILLAGR